MSAGRVLENKACVQTVLPDRLILVRQKLSENAKKWPNLTTLKIEACSQTVLPDMPILIGQK